MSVIRDVIGLQGKVLAALNLLVDQDIELFRLESHKQSLSFRLAHYLQDQFLYYHVDCEYNRHGEYKKYVGSDKQERESRPDIVVHRRNTDVDNLMVFEIKKIGYSAKEYRDAISKLCKFT